MNKEVRMVFSKIGHIQYIRELFNILRLAGPLCGAAQFGSAVVKCGGAAGAAAEQCDYTTWFVRESMAFLTFLFSLELLDKCHLTRHLTH